MEKTYLAFISYSHLDKEQAKWLQEKLESFRVPVYLQEKRSDLPEYVRPVFRDETDLELGFLTDNIHRALESSQFLIVIYSPNSRASGYVNDEINYFSKVSDKGNILPYIVDGEPNSDNECFPDALKRDTELLAANINELGRDYAAVKIIAKMLNLKIDDLWQRYCIMEEKEKQRIKDERDKLLIAQSRYISKEAIDISENDDSIFNTCLRAMAMMSEVYPKNISNPERPFTHEAYDALRILNDKSEHLEKVFTKNEWLSKVEISPDWKYLAYTNLTEHTVYIWDIGSGKIIKTLEGHTNQILSIQFSPDGRRVATTSEDKTVRIWDLETGKCTNVIEGHASAVLTCLFRQDGQVVVTKYADNTIVLWYLGDNANGLSAKVSDMQFSRDGKTMVVSTKNIVSVINISNKQCLYSFKEEDDVLFCCFNSDGSRIVTATRSNFVNMIDIKSGTYICSYCADIYPERRRDDKITENDIAQEVYQASLYIKHSPDMNTLAFRTTRECAAILDLESGNIRTLEGHTNNISSLKYSTDGKRIITASYDDTVRIWDVDSGKCVQDISSCTGTPYSAFYSPDGKQVAIVSSNNIGIYNTDIHEHTNLSLGKGLWAKSAHLSPDYKFAFIEYGYAPASIWNIETKEQYKTFNRVPDRVHTAQYSPDGKFIAMAMSNKTIRILDVDSYECIATLRGYESSVNSLHFNPDGKYIVAALGNWLLNNDNCAMVWNIKSKEIVNILYGHTHSVMTAQFSPDGKSIVTASDDKTARIWDAGSGICQKVLAGHTKKVYNAQFSPDGKNIVTASEDNTIRIWNVESGRCTKTLNEHTSWVHSVQYSPNGKRIVSKSEDRSVRIWDIENGQCISVLEFILPAGSAQFCYDDEHVLVISPDDILSIYYIPDSQKLMDVTMKKLNGYMLSEEDRKKYYLE